MRPELLDFTRGALARGVSRADIAAILHRAGWAEADIQTALDAFADIEFPIPVPKPKPYLSAREVFTYLTLFTALYFTAYNLISVTLQLIDRFFPDPLYNRVAAPNASDMRWNLACLIIAFPVFVVAFRVVNRAIEADPTKRDSPPRRWLTYLTLFIAVLVLTGDLSLLLYNVLGGEITIRFVLKVAAVAVITGGSFSYFLWDISKDEKP
jgi:hypothetical protein